MMEKWSWLMLNIGKEGASQGKRGEKIEEIQYIRKR